MIRLSQVARKLNIGKNTILDFLKSKGFKVDDNPNSKISVEQFQELSREFAASALDKEEALGLTIGKKHSDNFVIDSEIDEEEINTDDEEEILIKTISASKKAEEEIEEEKKNISKEKEAGAVWDEKPQLKGIKVVGKIDLGKEPEVIKPEAKKPEEKKVEKVEVKDKTEPEKEEPIESEKAVGERKPEEEEEKVDRVTEEKKEKQEKDVIASRAT